MRNKLAWGLLALIGGYQLIRRLGQRGGATNEEVDTSLPGDDVIPHPMVETTHAITIQAPPSEVWRWLVQAGYRGSGRAGWYTDSPIDPLVDVFFQLTTPADRKTADRSWMHSADHILLEFQQHTVGDIVPDGPPDTAYFTVRAVEPERLLVLYSDTHIKLMTPRSLHGTRWASYGEFTWNFILQPVGENSTRFILRTRARFGPASFRRLAPPLLYVSEVIFPRQLLRGIKQRAERNHIP
jgi:uncharacterized protein YndB with AHSA1/START domain